MKIKRPKIDWIQFDSSLEWEIYLAFKDGSIWDKVPELKGYKIIETKLESYEILPWFKAWEKTFKSLKYTPDFIIQKGKWPKIVLEVKSAFTAKKVDYRLRVKLFLSFYKDKLKFAELTKYNNKKYEYIEYF